MSPLDNHKAALVPSSGKTVDTKETKRKFEDLEFENNSNFDAIDRALQFVAVCDVSEHDEQRDEMNMFDLVVDGSSAFSMKEGSEFEDYHKVNDGRKLNKGANHRKSYSQSMKKRAISLKEGGLSAQNIAQILGTAKSNVEKWCSKKVCRHILIF